MQELIDKEATLKKMCESCGYCEMFEKAMRSTHPGFVSDKCNNYKFLTEQPTIEPEVQHGWWIPQESGRYKCSRCGHEVEITVSELVDPRDYGCYLDDYCGGCGAKMDATDMNIGGKGEGRCRV